MTSKSKQSRREDSKKDDPTPQASQVSMSDLTSLLEEHRKSISSALSAELKASFSSLESKLDVIQATVSENGERIASLETNANSNEDRFRALESSCATLTELCTKLKAKNTDLEGRSRRNNLRIIGLPESIEGPRPTHFFSDALVEILGVDVLETAPELDRAHRTFAAKPRQGDRPRPVIVCFHRHQTKDLVIREARKRRNELKYRDNPVRIYEDYCPDVLEQRAAYRDIMAVLYNMGLRPALLYPARLQITDKDGGRQAFREFLRSEFSEENLEFWLACEDYRVTSLNLQKTKSSSIYSQFINPDAPQEVNLDAETREALLSVTDSLCADTFSNAQQRIYNLMAKDSFPRFLRSPHCMEAIKAL